MFGFRTNHVCAIADKTSESYLPVISPFASVFEKGKRRLKKLILVAEKNPYSFVFLRNHTRIIQERQKQVASQSWIIHPFSMFRLYYEVYMCFVLLGCLLFMPLHAVFGFLLGHNSTYIHNTLSGCCIVDIVLNFLTGRIVSHEEILMELKTIAKNYLFGPYFICDLLSSIPDLDLLIEAIDFRYIQYFLLLKVIRIYTFMQYYEKTMNYFKVRRKIYIVFKIGLVCILSLHFLTCVEYFVEVELAALYAGNQTQLLDLIKDKNLGEFYDTYMNHSYFTSALLLSVDTFNKWPKLPGSYILSILYFIAGKILVSFLTVVLLDLMKSSNTLEIKYYQMMSQVHSYMSANKFPECLQKRLDQMYFYKYRQKYINETKIEKYMSEKLKKEIKYHVCRKLVHHVKCFQKLPREIVEDILPYLRKEIYLSTDSIVKAGASGDCMYFLESGTVSVCSPSGKEICHLQDGDYFGEVCLMLPKTKRTATVIALETCELYKLERKYFRKCVIPHPVAYNLLLQEAKARYMETKMIESTFIKSVE